MKTTTTIAITIMVIFLMSFSLAGDIKIFPGETQVFQNKMGIENLVYTIIGNSSPVSPLDVKINSTNITIIFPQDMIPDNFHIVFIEEQTREVVQIVYRGGGSSRIKYVDNNITIYVPEYINITEIVEVPVEIIVDNTTVLQNIFELWQVLLAMFIGGVFVFSIMWKRRRRKVEGEE